VIYVPPFLLLSPALRQGMLSIEGRRVVILIIFDFKKIWMD
jgi:hypothetical protein